MRCIYDIKGKLPYNLSTKNFKQNNLQFLSHFTVTVSKLSVSKTPLSVGHSTLDAGPDDISL